jgi:hypothetical protein
MTCRSFGTDAKLKAISRKEISITLTKRDWIKHIAAGLERYADPQTCAQILEDCGRRCTPVGLVEKATSLYETSDDIDEFLERLSKTFEGLHVEEQGVFVEWSQCGCPVIKGIPMEEIPNIFCCCSIGWLKGLFEVATRRPVEVTLLGSIVQGDKRCRLEITFP